MILCSDPLATTNTLSDDLFNEKSGELPAIRAGIPQRKIAVMPKVLSVPPGSAPVATFAFEDGDGRRGGIQSDISSVRMHLGELC